MLMPMPNADSNANIYVHARLDLVFLHPLQIIMIIINNVHLVNHRRLPQTIV